VWYWHRYVLTLSFWLTLPARNMLQERVYFNAGPKILEVCLNAGGQTSDLEPWLAWHVCIMHWVEMWFY